MVSKRVFLSGKVQGVSFRFHAYEKAKDLNVTGWIRNLDDGRVEMVVGGSTAAVESMIKWAHKGPQGAHVEHVEISDAKESPREPFYIRREGGK